MENELLTVGLVLAAYLTLMVTLAHKSLREVKIRIKQWQEIKTDARTLRAVMDERIAHYQAQSVALIEQTRLRHWYSPSEIKARLYPQFDPKYHEATFLSITRSDENGIPITIWLSVIFGIDPDDRDSVQILIYGQDDQLSHKIKRPRSEFFTEQGLYSNEWMALMLTYDAYANPQPELKPQPQ